MKKYIKPTAETILVATTALLTGSNIENYQGEYDGTQVLKSKESFFDFGEDEE